MKCFLKTVFIGKEINFSAYAGFIVFSIRFQRYKERKVLGGGLKDMTISLTEGHRRALFSKLCTWPVFNVCFHTFPIWILKCFRHEKCSFACLYSCVKIWASCMEYLWKYAFKRRRCAKFKSWQFFSKCFPLFLETSSHVIFVFNCI